MIKLIVESTMSPTLTMRKNNNAIIRECCPEHYEIGKRYPDFYMLEPFIEEYDVDLNSVSDGDILIRDWQYGHLKNTGYRPCQVVLTDSTNSIQLFDGYSNYSVCKDPIISKDTHWHRLNINYLYSK